MERGPVTLLRAEQADGILALTLNRPENVNALSLTLTEELIQTLTAARDVRLCLLRGEGKH